MRSTHTSHFPAIPRWLAAFALMGSALIGCDPEPEPAMGRSGTALSVDFVGATDVVGFRMYVERVSCSPGDAFEPLTLHADVDLLDGLMPGMVELLEQRLDPTSRHVGADLFVALPAGCYDIVAAPAAAFDGDDFTPSAECAVARARGVEVSAGQTTEPPPMISQCLGAPGGHLDIPVVLNHPPSLTVEIDEKFAYECEPVRICATVTDVDDDPVEVEFDVLAEGDAVHAVDVGELRLVGFARGARIWQQCADVTLRITDSYTVDVTAYDLALRDGQPVRFESLLADAHAGEPGAAPTSHDQQRVPLHINWVEEPLCFNGDGALVPALGVEIERAEGCAYIDTETYYCEMGRADIRDLVCPDGELDEQALYRDCPGCQAASEAICDGLDDDCDGRIDEGVQNACGACGEVPDEVCNGIDDDCDGPTDEGVQNACGGCGAVPAEQRNGRDDDCDGRVDEGTCEPIDLDFYPDHGECGPGNGTEEWRVRCMAAGNGCGAAEHHAWCFRRIDNSWRDWVTAQARARFPECLDWEWVEHEGPDWLTCRRFVDDICPDAHLRYQTPLMLLFGDAMQTGPEYLSVSRESHPLDLSSSQDGSGVSRTWARGDWLLMPPAAGEAVSGRDLLGNATLDRQGKARFKSGFEALAGVYDFDGDGWIVSAEMLGSAEHAVPELVSWRDDGDRKIQTHELTGLTELGVLAIRAVPRDDEVRFVSPNGDGFTRGLAEAYVIRGDAIEKAVVVDVFLR